VLIPAVAVLHAFQLVKFSTGLLLDKGTFPRSPAHQLQSCPPPPSHSQRCASSRRALGEVEP